MITLYWQEVLLLVALGSLPVLGVGIKCIELRLRVRSQLAATEAAEAEVKRLKKQAAEESARVERQLLDLRYRVAEAVRDFTAGRNNTLIIPEDRMQQSIAYITKGRVEQEVVDTNRFGWRFTIGMGLPKHSTIELHAAITAERCRDMVITALLEHYKKQSCIQLPPSKESTNHDSL